MRTPQIKDLRNKETWIVDSVMKFREVMQDYWHPVSIMDALRYLNQETNEARDAWMRQTRNHARNRDRESGFREELADVIIMGATALGSKDGWHPHPEIVDITSDVDDLCSLASSAIDMYRWMEWFSAKGKSEWWLMDTERVVLGSIERLGDDFRKIVVKKMVYLVDRHVPPQERKAIMMEMPWLLEEIST